MGPPLKDYAFAVDMYNEGMSLADIGKYVGISRQALWDILKRRGVKFRSQKRYGKENHFWRGSSDDDRAQNLVEKAILRGEIVPPNCCSICGSSYRFKDGRRAIQAHHDDYNKPLEVRWLCQKCHHKWHKENLALQRKD